MPSTSPGRAPSTPSSFAQILPGAPTTSLQTFDSFIFRHKRYICYISGRQVNLLSSPTTLVQALTFDKDLLAIAAETRTGKVVVAGKKDVWVLEPQAEGWTRVWWEKALYLVRADAGDDTTCLSWGNDGEVLVGGNRQLSLFSTLPSSRTSSPSGHGEALEERRMLWSQSVPSAVHSARFCPSASIIATCGICDRLVKIWRRLSFEEGLFDYTYLPHPGAVTHLEWRPLDERNDERRESGVNGRNEDDSEILYTIANDGILRVWRTGATHDLDILVLHTTVDLNSAIPQSPSLTVKGGEDALPARYCFLLPSEPFGDAVTAAIGLQTEKLSHSLEHVKEMASKSPDVVISLDGSGRMSAWGLQSVGHKRRPDTPSGYSRSAFHIAHAEGLPLRIAEGANARFQSWFDERTFNVLAHSFGDYLQWWTGDVESFFSTAAAGSERLREVSCWTGHLHSPINVLNGSPSTQAFISCAEGRQVSYWSAERADGVLHQRGSYPPKGRVLDAVFIAKPEHENNIVTLEQSLSDASQLVVALTNCAGRELEKRSHVLDLTNDKVEWSLQASGCSSIDHDQHVVGLSNHGKGFVASVGSTAGSKPRLGALRPFSLPLPDMSDIMVHTAAVLDADNTDKVGFVGIDKSGALQLYHMDLSNTDGPLEPVFMVSFECGVPDASILAVSNDFAVAASSQGDRLAIINLRDGYVEHRQPAASGRICHIVPSPNASLVAVGYDTHVNIIAQGRYEHHDELPSWILLKQISISGFALTVDTLAWLGNNDIVIGAGNGMLVSSGEVAVEEMHAHVQEAVDARLEVQPVNRLSNLAHLLRKPLPVWHPSLVSHTVRHGHWGLASKLVHNLSHKLKFWSEGDELHPLLDLPAEQVYEGSLLNSDTNLDPDVVNDLVQQLEEKDLPEISQTEQQRLKLVVQAMAFCSEHVSGLDNGALRFLFSWRLELLRSSEATYSHGTQTNGIIPVIPEMHWREIVFAYHSATQQSLLDILIAHYDNKITWTIARRLGLFAWLSDRQALEQIFEALAQSAYRSASPADPINASLYFLALHKKPALLALWRIATWHKEQRATMNFLKRDFSQPDNKTAARKNAYALMGKKRFDYAAAFFLLAEDLGSATSVLASQCDDIMLAIAVARLYSGDGSLVLRKILRDRLMAQATKNGDRWLMSWCHSILLERDYAAEVLVAPLEGVRTWQQDDPDTLTLYRKLRKNESEHEWEAVLRAARILRRMGLWLLALELVSQWEFKPLTRTALSSTPSRAKTNGVQYDVQSAEPRSMLDGFMNDATVPKVAPSMLDAFEQPAPPLRDGSNDKAAREAKAAELMRKMKAKKEAAQPTMNEKKPEPTQFKEPDANSLLDSFGF